MNCNTTHYRANSSSVPGDPTTQAGSYTCVVSNSLGVATSAVVALSVVSGPNSPYAREIVALRPMAYWRLDETSGTVAYDYANGNNGAYNNVGLGRAGYDSTATTKTDPTELSTQFFGPDGGQSYVSIPTIDLSVTNGNGEFTISAWVQASTTIDTDAGIVTKGYGSGDEEFNLDCGGGSHAFRFFVRDSSGATHTGSSTVRPDGRWHFLAGVCDQANGAVYLYIDGTNAAQGTINAGSGIHTGSVPASIGARPGGNGQPYNFQFMGLIDDVAIFSNAMSAAQIRIMYNAAQLGPAITQQPLANWQVFQGATASNSVSVAGSSPTYQWYGPNGFISGATGSTLILSNVQPSDSGNYYAAVFNLYGNAQSLNANLQVIPGPPLLFQDLSPLVASVYPSNSLTYSVSVGGTTPFYAQWFQNGNAVPTATNLSYSFISQPGTNSYDCVITNANGSVTSSVAVVYGLAPPATASYLQQILGDSPIALWRLDEPSNSAVAYDSIGAHNGQYSNVLSGVAGFNASDAPDIAAQFGLLATNNSLVANIQGINLSQLEVSNNAEYSVEAWVNWSAAQLANGSGIVAQGNSASEENFSLAVSGTNYQFTFHDASGAAHSVSSPAQADGNWHYLAATVDEANSQLLLYVDAATNADAVSSPPAPGQGETADVNPLAIGSRQSGAAGAGYDDQFVGAIAEVAIYNYPLRPAQVQAHYSAGTNAVAVSVTLSLQVSASQIQLTWPAGTLQSAPDVAGPYADVAGASSPYQFTPSAAQQFFRVRGQ